MNLTQQYDTHIDIRIKILEANLSEFITVKLHKQIDENVYSRKCQRISRAITDLK